MKKKKQNKFIHGVNIIKEIKGDVKNQPLEDTEKSEPQMGLEPTTLRVLDRML